MRTRTNEPYLVADAAELEAPALQRLYAEWHAACSAETLPGLDFIDPLRLDYILGNIVLIDVVGDRFRYRLIGTDLVARRGKDNTGTWLDEHADPVTAHIGPHICRLVITARQPVRTCFQRRLNGRMHPGELLSLPIAGPDSAVARLLHGQIYAPGTPRLAYGDTD